MSWCWQRSAVPASLHCISYDSVDPSHDQHYRCMSNPVLHVLVMLYMTFIRALELALACSGFGVAMQVCESAYQARSPLVMHLR